MTNRALLAEGPMAAGLMASRSVIGKELPERLEAELATNAEAVDFTVISVILIKVK